MVLVDDTIHYYNFDESSGNLIDQHAALDGTLSGNTTQGVTGLINTAYDFDGDNDSVLFTSEVFVGPAVGFSVWINPNVVDVAGDGQVIYYHGTADTTVSEYLTLVSDEIHYVFGAAGGSNNRYDTTDANLTADNWYDIVVTGSGDGGIGAYQIWVNGVEKSVTFSSAGANRARPSGIVRLSRVGLDVGEFLPNFNGTIDEFGMFDAEIVDADIASLYASGAGWAYPFAVAGTNTQINIGDTWKEISAMQINIGDVWKEVTSAQINIGDTWKSIF